MLIRLVVAVGLSAVVLTACSDDGAVGDPPAEMYALQPDDSWQLHEAVDPKADDPLTARERPSLDWYAEYVRSQHTEMVRLSGHGADLEETRTELERLGFAFVSVGVSVNGAIPTYAQPTPSAET